MRLTSEMLSQAEWALNEAFDEILEELAHRVLLAATSSDAKGYGVSENDKGKIPITSAMYHAGEKVMIEHPAFDSYSLAGLAAVYRAMHAARGDVAKRLKGKK